MVKIGGATEHYGKQIVVNEAQTHPLKSLLGKTVGPLLKGPINM